MEYQFTNHDFLKLLYVLPVFWITTVLGYRRLSPLRIALSTFLRTFVFLLVVLVLAGFSWKEKSKREISAVFLVDISDSVTQEGKEWMWDYVKDVEKNMDKNIKKGLVIFGGESKAITPTLMEDLKLDNIDEEFMRLDISTDRTDIAGGIMATLGVMPEDSSKMVILLSDGNQNLGNVLKAAKMAASNEVKIFVASPPVRKESEILIKKVNVPKETSEGEKFNIRVVVENRNDTAIKGNLKLHQEDNLLEEWDTEFKKGINVFDFPYKSEEKGFAKFNANLNIEDTSFDKDEENNSKVAFVNISGKTKLLYINGAENQKMYLPEALEDKTIAVDIKKPDQIPNTLQEYLKYDSLIFSNVSKDFLNDGQMNLIERYVKDFGGGFVMTCGTNITAEGGYSNTKIEEILPVKIIGGEPPKKEKKTRLSLVLIIDKSGSMLGKKMLFAKKASIELLKQLKKNDNFGIIAFDTIPYTIVELKPNEEVKKEIIRKLSMLNADGGTDIFPAMDAAYQQLTQKNSRVNHVILLSDGNTRSIFYQYNRLISRFQQANVTVSTIALGSWLVNTKLLKDIAKRTRGQFYQVTDIIKLPRLVVQDSDFFVSQSDFHEEHFYPRINQGSQILKGIYEKQFPPLKGYTITEAKEKAEIPLVTNIMGKTDPILANWRYGLGKVVIYASDANARWSSKWINWLKFNKFWSQVMRWSMRDISKADYDINVKADDNAVSILIESSLQVEDDTKLEVSLLTPDFVGDGQKLTLKQSAPKRFTSELKDINPGIYTLKISRIKGEKVVDLKTKGLIVPEKIFAKPLEYSSHGNNVSFLKNIAEITGGKYNPKKEEIVVEEIETTIAKDFAKYLIPLAIILFIFDIAARKFNRQMV
ncbi:MAG: von Willebrand factor type A domain protein [Candidatus Scalindua rubra]|uniref:von Willebrand factor type A domain protein n=1 Tax=Candidatus Scalindua rubra TaxID=1872076 RepID=A0A1E3XB63_9BACT|nr:MAG: von Willebrand factor type A domain protein [Candidatus Scalindua rubra]